MTEPESENAPAMTREEVIEFLRREFPQIEIGNRIVLDSIGPMVASMRMPHHDSNLRPGGTVSGPAMFALADVTLYAAILAQIGPVGLAVTTNMNINFMSRPAPRDLVADCRLMKLGSRLAVGEVWLRSDGSTKPVAHATGTYSIPPR